MCLWTFKWVGGPWVGDLGCAVFVVEWPNLKNFDLNNILNLIIMKLKFESLDFEKSEYENLEFEILELKIWILKFGI